MIRPFDWRDVGLVRALSERGLCLDSATRLTRGTQPLQSALLAYLMPRAGTPTLIWRDEGHSAFGQLRHRAGDERARALFIAPGWSIEPAGWLALVDQLAVEAGGRGGHNLLAEVDESSPEFEALRISGFAIYARQTIWRLNHDLAPTAPALPLRHASKEDGPNTLALYNDIVPRLVQQVEPTPEAGRGYVLERGHDLVAHLAVRRGPLGIWVDPVVHPEAFDLADEIVSSALHFLTSANRAGRPVYVNVRRYQDWLQEPLRLAGFEKVASQAVMVKRLVVRVTEPALQSIPAIAARNTRPVAQVERLIHIHPPNRAGLTSGSDEPSTIAGL